MAATELKRSSGFALERAREHLRDAHRNVGAHERERRQIARRIFARESGERGRGELPLIARGRRCPVHAVRLGRRGRPARIRREALGELGARNAPLPAEQPDAPGGRDPRRLGRERAVDGAAGVHVGDGGAGGAKELENEGEILGAGAREARPERFARDPAAQIARAALQLRGCAPSNSRWWGSTGDSDARDCALRRAATTRDRHRAS